MSFSNDELVILLVILAIFLSVVIYIAFDRILDFLPCCRKRPAQADPIESYIKDQPTDDKTFSGTSASTPSESQPTEPAVTVTPLSRTKVSDSNSKEPQQSSSQNFMKILEKIEAQDNDAKEQAAERERRRRRRLYAEQQRLLSKAASSTSGLEINSSDETGSQTYIGLPPEAAPKDPGKIQLGLIVAQDRTTDSET